jgi:hypothetical protein
MKKLILICATVVCVSTRAQSSFDKEHPPISFVSHGKDTLYLLNDDFGKLVASVWNGKFYKPERDGKKPTIVFVSHQYIQMRHKANAKKTVVSK